MGSAFLRACKKTNLVVVNVSVVNQLIDPPDGPCLTYLLLSHGAFGLDAVTMLFHAATVYQIINARNTDPRRDGSVGPFGLLPETMLSHGGRCDVRAEDKRYV